MRIKNVKLGEIDLKDLLNEMKTSGTDANSFREGYKRMMLIINKYLEGLNKNKRDE